MEESVFLQLLMDISSAIDKKDKKYVEMLKVLYKDLANIQSELEESKSAFDLFKVLRASGILKPTDISILFETIELTGLKFLKEIIKNYKAYPDEVKITQFTAHRLKVVALGKDFSLKDLLKASQLSEGKFSSNPWKLIQHLEDSFILTEDKVSSFCQRLTESNVNEDFNELLVKISDEIDKKDKHVDMLRVLYKDLANVKSDLEEAKCAFDLFEILRVADILKPTDISVLFETIELTGLRYLTKIIETYKTYPDKVEITLFSKHRQHVLALGKEFSVKKLEKVRQKYEIPVGISTNPWKVIAFLEDEDIVSEDKLSSFLKNLQRIGNQNEAEYVVALSNPQDQEQLNQDLTIKDSLTKYLKNWYKDVNLITPAMWNEYHVVDLADVFTELSLQIFCREKEQKRSRGKAKSTCIKKDGKSTSLTEVFDVMKSTKSCKVLITGQGGMGKTTLLRYIAYNWAIDNVHNPFDGKLLFLINIRNIITSGHFVDIIMKQIDTKELILKKKLSTEAVETFLFTHDDEIVILLDGYDELVTDAKDLVSLFKGGQFKRSTVVITSRPENLATLLKLCDVHIEVKGFSKIRIKKYIKKHFDCVGKTRLGKLLIDKFRIYIQRSYPVLRGPHAKAFTLCSSPLLLLQICTIWEQRQQLPEDLLDLFKEIICCILNQYISKIGNETTISQFERISELYKHAILILGKCMYEGLKLNKLTIDKHDLIRMKGKEEVDIDLVLKLGFVYEDTPINRPGELRTIFTTPHKLLSEALAAIYLSEQIQKEILDANEYELIRSSEYLHMTRVFTIGFLGADAGKLLKHWLIIRASNYFSIAQCFKHVKEDVKHHVIQELDNHMSNEMKAYSEQMCESFRSVLGKEYHNQHLFEILEMNFSVGLQEKAFPLVNTSSSEETFRNSCRIIAHTSVLIDQNDETNASIEIQTNIKQPATHFFQLISCLNINQINIFLAEMKYLDIKYNYVNLSITGKYLCLNSTFLIYFLQNSYKLSDLAFNNGTLTATNLSAVINELHKIHFKLKLERLYIRENDLHDINGTLLRKLFEIAPKLNYLMITKCGLSANIVNEMLEECDKMHVELKDILLNLEYNDLSDFDGKSLSEFVSVICDKQYPFDFQWNRYCLNADNLRKMVESVVESRTLIWKSVDISETNLSSISGETLARLLKISPNLKHINMCQCRLSGSIVSELLAECGRMNVVLKDHLLDLKHNDLSDIDGKSLYNLLRLIYSPYLRGKEKGIQYKNNCIGLRWYDYSFTADNLEKMIESIWTNETLIWENIDISDTNMSSIRGKTLARLLKISPNLIHINMTNCNLSDSIVSEMLDECDRMNLQLKDNMFNLLDNQVSELDKLARVRRDFCECVNLRCDHKKFGLDCLFR